MGTKGLIICYLALLCFTSICGLADKDGGKACTKECPDENEVCGFDEEEEEICICIEGFAKKGDVCTACSCGVNGICSFGEDEQEERCECKDGFAKKEGICTACSCGVNGICSFGEDEQEERCECKDGFAKKEGICTACSCGVNGICSFGEDEQEERCECKDGFAKKEGICTACSCGVNGICSFGEDEQEERCECKDGFAKKEGICTACSCGVNGICSFGEDEQEERCECKDGFAKKEGICTACSCGVNGICSFDEDEQEERCECKDGFAKKEGICTACSCGVNGICSFGEDEQEERCECKDGFAKKEGICTACSCGVNGICSFDEDEQEERCECKDGFAKKEGICTACSCGVNGICSFGEDEQEERCECKDGFAKKEGICTACLSSCGDNEVCSFDKDGNEECVCKEGFVSKEDVCTTKCDQTDNTCQNGGKCNDDETSPFCECKPGTSGDLCSVVDACQPDSDFCGKGEGVNCKYDETKGEAYCECTDPSKKFDTSSKVCRTCACGDNEICSFDDNGAKVCVCKDGYAKKEDVCTRICDEAQNVCKHGSVCKEEPDDGPSFCSCKAGTSGDLCSVINACRDNAKFCGTEKEAICDYDETKEKAYCRCKSDSKKFDTVSQTCRSVCEKDSSCFNEGRCTADVDNSENKFCRCEKGTSGDFCLEVDDCLDGILHCGEAENVICMWDPKVKLAKCDCKNGLFYDNETRTCLDCKACGKDSHGCKIGADNATICFCNEGFLQHEMECKECDCGQNGVCSFGELSEKVCTCDHGFLVYNEKCKKCQCGDNGTCSFVDGQRHCKCDDKYGFDGKECVDCQCGEATGCTFEEGKKNCQCLPDFAQKEEKCEECKCGKNSICSFVDGEKNCTCLPKFALKDGECVACDCHETSTGCIFDGDKIVCLCDKGYALNDTKCAKCDCVHGICSFEKGLKKCLCDKGYAFKDDICQVCDCGEHGKCLFDDSGTKFCKCDDGYAARNGRCQATCKQGDCKHGATCDEKTKFCTCKNGTKGDFCEIIADCLDSLKECTGDNGKCIYIEKDQKAECECPTGKEFDKSSKKCKLTCTEKGCKNEGLCKEKFCVCNEGTSGDLCDTVDGCSKLNETCQKATAECRYAAYKPGKAACFCTESGYSFDETQNKCKPIWCEENKCGSGSECKFEKGVGYCECKNSKQFYNYKSNKCEEYDPCLLKTCEANQICDKGTCKCAAPYKEVEKKCVPNFCSTNPCFSGATCVETEVPGVVNCVCNGKRFFDGTKCIDGSCFLPDYRQNCTEKCPPGLERDSNGICLHKNESHRCEKNCQYGSCVLKEDKETCVCIPKYAKLQDGVCILNAAVVCASKLLTDDLSKCNATEPYKYAENGITLEKKSCADKEVADKCLNAAATCKDSWNKETVHDCVCEEGYTKDSSGYCAEGCQLAKKLECMEEGKSCYINELKQAKCDCPPPLSWNEETKTCNKLDENTFMVQNLPVLKKKYVRKDGSIDKVLLNTDIIQSMKQVYKNIENTYMFNYDQSEDILNCSIIVKFSKDGKSEVKRIRMLKLPEINCTDCDENLSVLPPSLFLSSKSLDQVTDEQADLCSKPLTKTLCGDYAECKDNKCFCSNGFRVTDYSVQKYKQFTILRCEDVNECAEKNHVCQERTNSTCQNIIGGYYCKCLPGFKKIDTKLPFESQENKDPCNDLCTPDPCYKGTCMVKDKAFDCNCQLGYSGSLCNREDSPLKKANKSIKIVGAVLGTLLGVTILLFIAYVWRKKAYKYSEDFSIAPQYAGDTEMRDGRPMRGIANRAYE